MFFENLDKKIEDAGVRNGADFPVPPYPYLRTNRFLASLGPRLKDEREKEFWVERMQELDLRGRRAEIANLPDAAVQTLVGEKAGEEGRQKLYARIASCSQKMLDHDKTEKDFYATLQARIRIPDEYSTFLRVIGVHPIAALPVAMATENGRERFKAWFNADITRLPVEGRLEAYIPEGGFLLDPDQISRILKDSRRNPLRVPRPDKADGETLVRAFAPVIIQDAAAPFDSPGSLGWQGDQVSVMPGKPVVYYYLAHAFLNGKSILQIHYVIWYGARGGKAPPWFERGHVDGLTIRLSLDPRGKLFMVDMMNNCGCYHLFIPDPARVSQVLSPSSATPPFVPQDLPRLGAGERLGLRVNSGWHQVQRLLAIREPERSTPYELVPYQLLESLSTGSDQRRSAFDPEGIIRGTERSERIFLFPMGIPSVGSMRQRGHHAIDFIGKAHFDDPDLFERNFVLK